MICDQRVPAERAWLAPYYLRKRLGHLDPARFATEGDAVRKAVQQEPKLHRFVETVPTWLSEAGRRGVEHWNGDARRIWTGEPEAKEVFRRFDAFRGTAQKKAAMAVEILERDLGVQSATCIKVMWPTMCTYAAYSCGRISPRSTTAIT